MGFWSRRITNVAALMGGSGAQALLAAETDGLSIDFTDASLVVRDTTTTSNAWTAGNGDVQTFWRDRSFTSYASPSPKITRDSAGLYTYRPHNLLVMSERMQSAAWTATSLTVTDNTVANPLDGATTAATLALVDASATHQHAATAIAFVTTHRYTFSVYAKANTHGFLQLAFPTGSSTFSADSYANFNLSTGATSAGADATATATDVGSGWYRCSIVSTATASATTAPLIVLVSAIGAARAETHDPNSTNSVYAYGAMVNHGPTALTYTKTQAHNLCLQSQTLDNASWTNSETTETANSTVAPDGTTTGDTLTASAGAGFHDLSQVVSAISGATYTASLYAKAGTHRYLALEPNDAAAHGVGILVDLQTGTILSSAISVGGGYTLVSSSITGVGNSWYRIAITYTHNAEANTKFHIQIRQNSSDTTWTPNWNAAGTETVILWGAQLELASTVGKYVATTAAAVYESRYELPREWDSSGACQGLLVEEARTNICLYSTQIANAAWGAKAFVTDNYATSPSGQTDAARIVNAGGGDNVAQTITVSASTAYTFSFFAKNNGGSAARYRVYDLTNGADIVAATSFFGSINGSTWSRITVSFTTPVGCVSAIVYVYADIANADYLVWGAQLEAGAFATSPIYTGSASVTRARDFITASVNVMPSVQSAGTMYVQFTHKTTGGRFLVIDNGGTNEYMAFDCTAETTSRFNVRDGGADVALISVTINGFDTANKIAGSWASNDVAASANGGAVGTDTSATMPTTTSLSIGSAPDGDGNHNGYIKQVMVLPRAMSDAQLQTVTT
jgi:hypothetical protein